MGPTTSSSNQHHTFQYPVQQHEPGPSVMTTTSHAYISQCLIQVCTQRAQRAVSGMVEERLIVR